MTTRPEWHRCVRCLRLVADTAENLTAAGWCHAVRQTHLLCVCPDCARRYCEELAASGKNIGDYFDLPPHFPWEHWKRLRAERKAERTNAERERKERRATERAERKRLREEREAYRRANRKTPRPPPTPDQWAAVVANRGLIGAVIDRHCRHRLAAGVDRDELFSDGVLVLLRCVRDHDPARGRLSTLAFHALRCELGDWSRGFSRIPRLKTVRLTCDPPDYRITWERTVAEEVVSTTVAVEQLLGRLDTRTRLFIEMRCGLNGYEDMTLDQIGARFNVTKERVRQVVINGMRRLREVAATMRLRPPDYERGRPAARRSVIEEPNPGFDDIVRAYEDR